MKILLKLTALFMAAAMTAGIITSCKAEKGEDIIKPLFLYVGYRYNSTNSKYDEYTDADLQKLKDIGVTEICINFGNAPAAYIPVGETEPKQIVTEYDIENVITMESTGAESEEALSRIKEEYKTKLSGLDTRLMINDYADFAVEFAERLVAVNPDIEIWYSFPDIYIAALAELYVEPFLIYYDRLKAETSQEIWDNNIKGFYWVREDVPAAIYDQFNTENLENFDNETVKAMKACTDAAHKDGKLTFWCPYFRESENVATPIGYIANQTDIFDYVILQPNHVFQNDLEGNIEVIKQSTLKGAVLDQSGMPYGGEKSSQTGVGPEIEMQAEDFNGSSGEEVLARYQDYVDAYGDMLDEYPMAFYCGSRPSLMDEQVLSLLEAFLAKETDA